LIAPNPQGTGRPADREVSRRFGRFEAGAYPANAAVCARPVRLAAKLVARGFTLDPAGVAAGRPTALEVCPHAATIGLFDLQRTIKYKKGRVADKRAGLTTLQDLLHARLPRHPVVPIEPFPKEDPASLAGRALKGLEDRLDAVVCAAVGAHFRADPRNWHVLGDTAAGYIVVPVV
jgi:predicted RNase H-like nuclease